jgi:protein SCO1/2
MPVSSSSLRFIRLITYALIIIALGALAYFAFKPGSNGLFEANSYVGGPFTLVSDEGKDVTQDDFADKPKVMFFGFTYCPDICPTTLYEMADYIERLGPRAQNLHYMFITVDPERDTPEVLRGYVDDFSPHITGLTGTPLQISNMLKAYRVYAKKVPMNDTYLMDHTATVYLMDKNNKLVGTIAYGEDDETAMQKLTALAGGE